MAGHDVSPNPPDPVATDGEEGRRIGRAAFLGALGAGLAGIVIAPRIGGGVNRILGTVLPVPQDGWRIYNVAPPLPRFDPATYRLRVSGLVARPLHLSWPEVAALPGVAQTSDFHCVTGWSVPGVRWAGVRGRAVLELARPSPAARYVTVFSLEEPYADQISIEQLALPDVMLARAMDGRPLSREHGAPLRLVIPEMYGYKGVKWVSGLRFDSRPGLGFWEQRGYDVDAWVGRSNGHGG
jgi:DMSO/TMAO reductase YedYZ molybdopterin-dependent catalytic subunit